MAAEPHTPAPWHQACTSYDIELCRNHVTLERWLCIPETQQKWRMPGLVHVHLDVRLNDRHNVIPHLAFSFSLEMAQANVRLAELVAAINRQIAGNVRFVFCDYTDLPGTAGRGNFRVSNSCSASRRRAKQPRRWRHLCFSAPDQVCAADISVPTKLIVLARALTEMCNRKLAAELQSYVAPTDWGFRCVR